jgi:hypothetical protein
MGRPESKGESSMWRGRVVNTDERREIKKQNDNNKEKSRGLPVIGRDLLRQKAWD